MLPYPRTKKSIQTQLDLQVTQASAPRRERRRGGRRLQDKFPPGGPRRRKEACSPAALGLECPLASRGAWIGETGADLRECRGRKREERGTRTLPRPRGREEEREIRGWGRKNRQRQVAAERKTVEKCALVSFSCYARGRGGSSVAASAWARRTIPDVRRDDHWSGFRRSP